MLPPIEIDTRELVLDFSLTQADTEQLAEDVVQVVTRALEMQWREEARNSLSQTREQYMNSIVVTKTSSTSNTITLVGMLPNMIEQGAEPFDMKEGFSRSNKKKLKANGGWYLTIPFAYGQHGSLGTSQKFSGVLPRHITKTLKRKQSKFGQGAVLSNSDLPKEHQIPQSRGTTKLVTGATMPEYTHKSSIYEGLTQPVKGGPVMSFRRVSDSSDDNSWIHTGITAYNLAEKAISKVDIPELVGETIDVFLDNMLGR